MWQTASINFTADLRLTQLTSQDVSKHLRSCIHGSKSRQTDGWYSLFAAAAAWIHYYTCLCEGLIHWIISLMNENSFSKRNGSGCSEELQKNGCTFSASPCLCALQSSFSSIVSNNTTQSIKKNKFRASHLNRLLFIPTSPPADHSPVPFHKSFFSSPSFLVLVLNVSNVRASSTPLPPHTHPNSSLISPYFLILPVSPPCQPWPS